MTGRVDDLVARLRAEKPIGMLSGCCDTVEPVNPDGPEAADEIDRLRGALIQCGRAAGAGLADTVSTDFLMLVPGEVEAKIAALRAQP